LADDAAGSFSLAFPDKTFAGDSVSQHGDCQLLDIVGRDEIPVVDHRLSLSGSVQRESASGADSERQLRVLTRRRDDGEQVIADGIVNAHVASGLLQALQL
jgi:hypothetical protein